MRLSESMCELLKNRMRFVNESDQSEAEYISELRQSVLARAEAENYNVDLDQLESVMFEAYDRDIPLEEAKEKVWLAVYVDKYAEPEDVE